MPRKLDTDWNVYTNFSEDLTGGSPGYNISETATSVIRLNEGDIAEFIIENSVGPSGVSEFHPWHFHGHSFWVVGRGNGTFNETEDVPKYNLQNPVIRDTVVGLKDSWVALVRTGSIHFIINETLQTVIANNIPLFFPTSFPPLIKRFVANNPGVWFLHCHIEAHLAMGMGFVVIVDPDKVGTLTESVQYCNSNELQAVVEDSFVDDSIQGEIEPENSSNSYSIVNDHRFVLSPAGITTAVIMLLSLL
jgi:L-ascorbate oxidase